MKTLTKELVDDVLRVYRDFEFSEQRRAIRGIHEFEWNNKTWWASTDAHRLLMIPKTKEFTPDDMNYFEFRANIPEVLPAVVQLTKSTIVNVHDLANLYNSIKMIERKMRVDCYSCEGEGEFYKDGHRYDCKMCDGEGYLESDEMEKIKDPNSRIKIGSTILKHGMIADLIRVCSKLDVHEMEVKFSSDRYIFMYIDKCATLIMASINESNTEVKTL
jgi:hypothetical protein